MPQTQLTGNRSVSSRLSGARHGRLGHDMAKRKRTHGSGSVRQLPSGKYQARIRTEDGRRIAAPRTFDTKLDANSWLNVQLDDMRDGNWIEPTSMKREKGLSVDEFFANFMSSRAISLRHEEIQRSQWKRLVSPRLGKMLIRRVTRDHIDAWRKTLDVNRVTQSNQVYALARQAFARAVEDGFLDTTPVRMQANFKKISREVVILSKEEMQTLIDRMPERYQTAIVIALWCGLREGEIIALRRRDIDLSSGVIHVRRSISRTKGKVFAKTPKSDAGNRTVGIPEKNALPWIVDHLDRFTDAEENALLWQGQRGEFIAESSLTRPFKKIVADMGYADMHFHDLRHTHATRVGRTGASLKEIQTRLGHSTPQAAMRYQHSTKVRQLEINKQLDELED